MDQLLACPPSHQRGRLLGWGVAVAVVLAAIAYATGQFDPAARGTILLAPDDAGVVALGQQIYQARCASCHGAQLEGQPHWRERGADGRLPAPPHDASGHTWHHSDELLFRLTKQGVVQVANLTGYNTAMPIYDGVLTDAEIVAVLSWIKSRWPAETRALHDEVNKQARNAR